MDEYVVMNKSDLTTMANSVRNATGTTESISAADLSNAVSRAIIPKPLTYDYMPEGYPKKDIGAVTLMEEQEVTFGKSGSNMLARTPTLDIEAGDKLTIIWDGVSYNVTVKTPEGAPPGVLAFGNLGLIGVGDAEDYPFVGGMENSAMVWKTADTATSHTIGVTRQQVTYTPMDVNFTPNNLNVVFSGINSTMPDSCNVTYDELRGWVENNIPVLSIYRLIDINSDYVESITTIRLKTDSLAIETVNHGFVYNSDGTFSQFV